MRKHLLLRPALWALVILATTVAWHLRPLDRTTLYPVPIANGKYGYVNADGRVVVGAEWEEASAYGADGFALVMKGSREAGKLGFIDRAGKLAEPLDEGFVGPRVLEIFGISRVVWRKLRGEMTITGQVVVINDEEFTPLRQGKPTKCGLARNGKTIIEPKWDGIQPFGACDLAPVKIGWKWGFVNRAGSVEIQPKWSYVGSFANNGLAVALSGQLFDYNAAKPGISRLNNEAMSIHSEFIDRKGKVVIPARWDSAWGFDDAGVAIVQKGEKFGAIDSTGKLVVPIEWDEIAPFDPHGMACVKQGLKYGYIDGTGAIIVPLEWDHIGSFDDIESISLEGDDTINQNGQKSSGGASRSVVRQGHQGIALVIQNDKYGRIDRKGNLVTPLEWDDIDAIGANGLARVKNNGKRGFIDRQNQIVIPLVWDDAVGFDEHGMARVVNNKKHGFIDSTGKIIVPLEWDDAWGFDAEGMTVVAKAKKFGAMNRAGKIVIPLEWDSFSEFQGDIVKVSKAKRVGFINRKGDTLVPAVWDYAVPYKLRFLDEDDKLRALLPRDDPYIPDLIEVTRDEKSGIIDWSGNIIIAPEWTQIDIRSDAEAKSAAFIVSRSIDDNNQVGWLKTGREWLFKLLGREEARSQLCHLYDTQGRLIWSSDWLSEAFWIWSVALAAGIVVLADSVAMWRRRKRPVAGTS